MKVVMLVPRRGGVPDRDRLWAFCRTWWLNDFPDWELFEGSGPDGPFCRSHAINEAAAKAGDWDVAVIIDADVLLDPQAVRSAVDLAVATDSMTLAYHRRVLLDGPGTDKIVSGFRGNWESLGRQCPDRYDACSSAVIVTRKLWDAVGGFDERFVGWGWEDVAFRVACETASGREMTKIASTCWHLFHITSSGNNRSESTFQKNKSLGDRYSAARFNREVMTEILSGHETGWAEAFDAEPARSVGIPPIIHRTVPESTDAEVESWWDGFVQAHPSADGWTCRTWRDPLNPDEFPETSGVWDQCSTGAQRAGLIRLEVIWRHGGIYVDSDVECYDTLLPLLNVGCFVAGWEDAKTIPDAVFAAPAKHPVTAELLDAARRSVERGDDPWHSGPGVFTRALPHAAKRGAAILLPPGSFYPYHWKSKDRDRRRDHKTEQPWALMAHHWRGSWLPENQGKA